MIIFIPILCQCLNNRKKKKKKKKQHQKGVKNMRK